MVRFGPSSLSNDALSARGDGETLLDFKGEVLVRVAATSAHPIDYKRRAGQTKDFYPIKFAGLMGVDIAGTVVKIGPGVEGFLSESTRPAAFR